MIECVVHRSLRNRVSLCAEEDRLNTLLVRHPDSAELNSWLVGEGLRVAEIAPERVIAGQSITAALSKLSTAGIERLPALP